ncbi:MAG: hypothetical protein LBC60_03310 [Spirochaetaceae bacterium]|jgi:hypothetical protein|nr:hypothetical protein [Spirochaetaceae bacterium]
MYKKSLIFFLIAVLSAGLIMVGCGNPIGDDGKTTNLQINGLLIDRIVTGEADLKAVLDDPDLEVIAFDIDTATHPAGGPKVP